MWIGSKYGWFSIVIKGPAYHVRARQRRDLRDLREACWPAGTAGEGPLVRRSYPGSDYPWRMITNAPELRLIMGVLAASVDYENFKGMIHDRPSQAAKASGYGRMWAIAKEWEQS